MLPTKQGSIRLFRLAGIDVYLHWLWFLVAAFRESIWWGLGCLFIPIVQLIFLIMHWQAAKKPFFLQLLGIALIIVAIIISPNTAHR